MWHWLLSWHALDVSLWTKRDSVCCSALWGGSMPASCRRRAPRHKVIALTQEGGILRSWVQFCTSLSQWLGMTASSAQSWRLDGAGHHLAIPQSAGDVQPNDMKLLQSWHDTLHGDPFPAVYIWTESYYICRFWSPSRIIEQRNT